MMVISSFSIGSQAGFSGRGRVPPLRGRRFDGRARLAGDLVGYRRHHDVAFTGIGLSPDQQGVAFADAGVAHGVVFHAVGEEVPS
jgi:hypothetical protein